jgi:phosphate starvation-inducible protein PhoH
MSQCDLKNKKDSGFDFFLKLEPQVSGIKVITLEQNHRHKIVEPVLKVFADYRE